MTTASVAASPGQGLGVARMVKRNLFQWKMLSLMKFKEVLFLLLKELLLKKVDCFAKKRATVIIKCFLL